MSRGRKPGGVAFRVVTNHEPMPAFVPAVERSRRYIGLALLLGVPLAFFAFVGLLWAAYYAVVGLGWVLAVWKAVLS